MRVCVVYKCRASILGAVENGAEEVIIHISLNLISYLHTRLTNMMDKSLLISASFSDSARKWGCPFPPSLSFPLLFPCVRWGCAENLDGPTLRYPGFADARSFAGRKVFADILRVWIVGRGATRMLLLLLLLLVTLWMHHLSLFGRWDRLTLDVRIHRLLHLHHTLMLVLRHWCRRRPVI